MKSFLRQAALPFRRYADFGGRSRRTELVAFWVLVTVVQVGPTFVLPLDFRAQVTFDLVVAAVILLPSAALFVRRVHDVGLSGWWLAPFIPIAAYNLWKGVDALANPYGIGGGPTLIDVVGLAFGMPALLMLLWDDQAGTNRFGPNPRYLDSQEPGPTSA